MSIISEKINKKIDAIKNEFEINKDVVHQGVKGSLNESEIASLIKDVIPQRYKVTKGIIENSIGEQSNETDIFIYDDEILPPYIKNDLTFVPVEAVKYNFEAKSTLNSNELKTTIEKFKKFKSIGGISPTVLFAFSSDIKGSELSRYKKNESSFFTNPAITVLCVSNKCYYYKCVTEHYVKDYISNTEFLELFNKATGIDLKGAKKTLRELMSNEEVLSQMSRSQLALLIQSIIQMNNLTNNFDDKELTINGIKYSEIKFKVHKWIGLEAGNNDIELSFLSGISNTLSKGNLGDYLLNGKKLDVKTFSICYEDMWGNVSCQEFDEKGLSYDTDKVRFASQTSKESNKIIFEIQK